MTPDTTRSKASLRVFLEYDYLTTRQLGDLLLGLDGLFDEIYYADYPAYRRLPNAEAARLRLDRVETGQSLTIYVMQGISQVVGSADPAMVGLVSGIAALATMASLLVRVLRQAENLRMKVRSDNREIIRQDLELQDKRLDITAKELTLRGDVKAVLAEHAPDRPERDQEALAERLTPHLDIILQTVSADNIARIEVTMPEQGSA